MAIPQTTVSNYQKLLLLFLAVLIYFPLFLHLDTHPVYQWDESRQAINAEEMAADGNIIVTHFYGKPDMYNTKPPLLIWLQTIGLKLNLKPELALRLPSALAAVATCFMLVAFMLKYYKNASWGFLAVMVLLSNGAYVNLHAARTGDYDALLTCFTTAYLLNFFQYSSSGNQKYLKYFFVFLSLAIMTKGIAALLFMPGLFLYLLVTKQFRALVVRKKFLVYGLIAFAVPALYYILRELMNPGYLQAVMDNELGGRYMKVNDGHDAPFAHYFHHIINNRFTDWYLLIPAGLVLLCAYKDRQRRQLGIYLSLLIATFFLIISSAETKIYWYDLPMYPLFAIAVSFVFYILIESISKIIPELPRYSLLFAVLLIFFSLPYARTVNTSYEAKPFEWETENYKISNYFRKALKHEKQLNGYAFYNNWDYIPQYTVYLRRLEKDGQKIDTVFSYDKIRVGQKLITHQKDVQDSVQKRFNVSLLEEEDNIRIFKILNEKDTTGK